MSVLRAWRDGWRRLRRPAEVEQDLDDELRHFFDEAVAEERARGLSQAAAERAVRLQHGSVLAAADPVREVGWEHAVETLLSDLRIAGRRLVGDPTFAVVTVLTIAVGIGVTTAMFGAVNAVLLQPLPYPASERVVAIWDVGADGAPLATTFGTYRELDERTSGFEELAVLKPWRPTLAVPGAPERLMGQRVSAGYFRVLGVPPALGRSFDDAEDRPGGRSEVVLSDSFWRRQFAADPKILGRTIELDERRFEVVGVMPASFENASAPAAVLWANLQYDLSQGRAWGHHLRMLGRLRTDLKLAAADAELDALAAAPIEAFPRPRWALLEKGLIVRTLHDEVTGGVRTTLFAVLGAASLLLAIAVVNVTHLLLTRGARRRGELGLRTALGAGRGRLIRQLLTESLLVAAVGGAAGLLVAHLGVRALVVFGPSDLPRLDAVSVDATVFLVGLGLTILAGTVSGAIPALVATIDDPRGALQGGSRHTAGRQWRIRHGLVVAEVALAVVLLVCSGLLLRSLHGLLAVDVGFETGAVHTMQVQVSGDRYDNAATDRFYSQALEAIHGVPGVVSATFTSQLPLSGDHDVYGVRIGLETADDEPRISVFRYTVSPGYTATMGIPLRVGRRLEARDREGAQRVAVVSQSLADRHLPGIDPIGQPLHIGPADRPPYTIVGVVGDVRQESLARDDAAAVYLAAGQWHFADDARSLVVRTAGGDLPLDAVHGAIWSIDPGRPMSQVVTLDELVAHSVAGRRFTLRLFEAFALAALLLAAVGLYGVLAGSVDERAREFGIRAALGAPGLSLLAMVLRRGLALTGLGAAVGVGGALVVTRSLDSLLYGVTPLDPATYAAGVLTFITVAAVACSRPAARAASVDPAQILRSE